MMPAMPLLADKPAPSTVIGIDPGLRRTGYAILTPDRLHYERSRLVEAGVIRLNVKASLPDRLVELTGELEALLAAHRPGLLACEELYAHYRHPRTAILMGHARGVILACAAQHGILVRPVPATQAKKMLTGAGHASKAQMQRAVQATLGLPVLPEPSDVADAIAIALCGIRLRAGALAEEG